MKELEYYKCHFCKKDSRMHKLGNIYRLNLSFGHGSTSFYDDKLICTKCLEKLSELKGEQDIGYWTVKQYQVPIENKQIPTISNIEHYEPTACKIVYTYTHSVCKSEEYLNKFKYCPNCGARMKDGCKSNG